MNIEESLQEVIHMISLKLICFWPDGVVLSHSVEEIIIDESLCFFPAELVGASITNLVSIVFEDVKGCLKNSRVFDDFVFFQNKEVFFPFLKNL